MRCQYYGHQSMMVCITAGVLGAVSKNKGEKGLDEEEEIGRWVTESPRVNQRAKFIEAATRKEYTPFSLVLSSI